MAFYPPKKELTLSHVIKYLLFRLYELKLNHGLLYIAFNFYSLNGTNEEIYTCILFGLEEARVVQRLVR